MNKKDLALLGALGLAGYIFIVKPRLSSASDLGSDSLGGASSTNPFGQIYDLVNSLNPYNIGQDIGRNLVTSVIGSTRYEAPAQVTTNLSTPKAVLTSSVMGSGSYYGATTYTSSGAAVVPTARSAQKAAVNYFVPKQSITTQAKVASSLGVPTRWINPNVNRRVQSSTAKNSSALFKYLK